MLSRKQKYVNQLHTGFATDVRGAKAPQAVPLPGRTPLSRPRPAAPGLARAGGRASCLPPTLALRPAHPAPALRRPPLPGQQILSDADASLPGIAGPRLAPMYPGMADACTPPLKICTTSLTWSPILYVPAPRAPPKTEALLPSQFIGAAVAAAGPRDCRGGPGPRPLGLQ